MTTNHPHFDTPEDVRDWAARLDDLAALDQRRTSGLEDRIFAATRASLPAGQTLAVIGPGSALRQQPARRRLLTPMRLAAAVAICTAGAAMWVATVTTPHAAPGPPTRIASAAQASADAELDYLVTLAGLDEGWGPLDERLGVLQLETDAVAGSLLWDVAWGSLLLTEGAM